mmetsp:Transcript_28547/g.66154  ORF Transcript_28547/g.66154 Transcript_28547/m.66154 type:complete len:263 (-) Transcript_28547:43-831(-)
MQKAGGAAGLPPPWVRGEIEAPAGRKNMGTWEAAVYTPEQQERLGVTETGEKVSKEGAGADASVVRTFAACTMSGQSATVECTGETTVAELTKILQEKLSISDTSYMRILAGSQLLAPQEAQLNALAAEAGNWPSNAPVDLNVIVGEMKVKRHVYQMRGGAPPYRGFHLTASDEILLWPGQALQEQLEACIPEQARGGIAAMDDPDPDTPRVNMGVWAGKGDPPSKWEEKLPEKLVLSSTAQEIFDSGKKAFVVFVPMRGMD